MPNDATVSSGQQPRTLSGQTQQQLDVRLVRTFLATLFAIVQWRNRAHGLLLSELGAYLTSPERAPAGTKAQLLCRARCSGPLALVR
jgi:hypothetical protein